jgi:hypothetical protein
MEPVALPVGGRFADSARMIRDRWQRLAVMVGCFSYVHAAEVEVLPPARTNASPEIRFVVIAPSPYSRRFDCARAGLGIALQLKRLSVEQKLPVLITFLNAVPLLEDPEKAKALVRGAPVLVVGGSTWAQGSSRYVRRFFEAVGEESLWGVNASAWATAGGSHTGGEVVVQDTFRSLMGMGANVFTLGQKLMVFTTDERLDYGAGQFTLLDCWYMEQFAKALLVNAHARGDAARASTLAGQAGLTHMYYFGHPKEESELKERHSEIRDLINQASAKPDVLIAIGKRLALDGPPQLELPEKVPGK